MRRCWSLLPTLGVIRDLADDDDHPKPQLPTARARVRGKGPRSLGGGLRAFVSPDVEGKAVRLRGCAIWSSTRFLGARGNVG